MSQVDLLGTPTISPDSASLGENEFVQISSTVQGSQIFYTTDGSIPDMSAFLYNQPFSLGSISLGQKVRIAAIAYHSKYVPSQVVTADYLISNSGGSTNLWEILVILLVCILFVGIGIFLFIRYARRPSPGMNSSGGTTAMSRKSNASLMTPLIAGTANAADDTSLLNMILKEDEVHFGKAVARGAFGVVHKGILRKTPVAIKVVALEKEHFGSSDWDDSVIQDMRAALEEEAKVWNRLRHPNICLLMGVCLHPRRCPMFLVTEYCQHGSLFDIIHNFSVNFEWQMRHKLAMGAAKGLQYLHEFNPPVLHRDMKSPNILVDGEWVAKLSDFGLSRVLPYQEVDQISDILVTGHAGTAPWMSPEILPEPGVRRKGVYYSTKSDVYAFGIVLWEIASRQQPGAGFRTTAEIARYVRDGGRPKIPTNIQWPQGWESLIRRCWDQNPGERPSMAQVVQCLEDIGSSQRYKWVTATDGVQF